MPIDDEDDDEDPADDVRVTTLTPMPERANRRGPASYDAPSATTQIKLNRFCWEGRCSRYWLSITGQRVVFEGQRNGVPGRQYGTISAQQLATLVEAFEQVHFFELQDSYSDELCKSKEAYRKFAPQMNVHLSLGSRTKTVDDDWGCETEARVDLEWLEQQIDAIAGTHRFINGTAPAQPSLYCNVFDNPHGCVMWDPPADE